MSYKMLNSIKFAENILRIKNLRSCKRLFLTEAYKCEESWKKRLDSPLLQQVNPADMFLQLDHQFSTKGKVSAIDIDIFANTVRERFQVEELLNLIHQLRLTVETSNTLESTHYAVIRFLLEQNHIKDLLEILDDRLNYGIFPDYYCSNILMDHFIKQKDFTSAARIASLLMLQEDAGHPISNTLSIYSCHKYLENPVDWRPPKTANDSEEEVKVRVKYIRNPYFDDHFDLSEPLHIIGKTLAFQGKHMNNSLGRTCQLRGLILYKKYDKAIELIKKWQQEISENIVHKEVFDLIKQDNTLISDNQVSKELENLHKELTSLQNCNLHHENLSERIENEIKRTIDEHNENDISQQQKNFLAWEQTREIILNQQMTEMDRQMRLKNIEKLKKELKEKEEILTFFEHEEEIELEIEKIKEKEQQEGEKLKKNYFLAKQLKKLEKKIEVYEPPNI